MLKGWSVTLVAALFAVRLGSGWAAAVDGTSEVVDYSCPRAASGG